MSLHRTRTPPYGTAGLAGIGDVDADGVPDLIYGDPSYRDLHGNPIGFASAISGKTGTHLYDNTGGVGSSMGICLRGMGDTDGDGLPDFGFGVAALPAWVVLGSASGTTWINLSGYAADSFSNVIPTHALTPVGDIDGDGAVDFAAGCRDVNTDIGCVDVRSGKTGALLYTLVGATKDEMFGSALGSCADVDGDGVRELLLAAPKRVVNGVPGRVPRLLRQDGRDARSTATPINSTSASTSTDSTTSTGTASATSSSPRRASIASRSSPAPRAASWSDSRAEARIASATSAT